MYQRFVILILATCMMFASGCNQNSPSGPEVSVTLKPESGRFGISHMGGLAKKSALAEVKEGPGVSFNLGQIKGSTGYFFLLYNIGAVPITNVSLAIGTPGYAVFPTSMDTLIPGSDVGMLPVVKVSAFHGTAYDGVGTRPLLPMGNNTFTLHIEGTSKTASGADTTIELEAAMNLEAMVMDLDVSGKSGSITTSPFQGNINETFEGVPGVKNERIYSCNTECVDDSVVAITNTGNVPLHITLYSSSISPGSQRVVATRLFDSTIALSDTCKFTFDSDIDQQRFLVIASGENTVSNPDKVMLQDNGSFYLVINPGENNCEDTLVLQSYRDFLASHENTDCVKSWALIDNKALFYGESFNDGDSVRFALIDMTDTTVITSCTGTSTPQSTLLNRDDSYMGEYNELFVALILNLYSNGDMKLKDSQASQITSGGQSGTWNRSTTVSF